MPYPKELYRPHSHPVTRNSGACRGTPASRAHNLLLLFTHSLRCGLEECRQPRWLALISFLIIIGTAAAVAREPAPEILGIRLGMKYASAHTRLTRIGHFKSEDEGQEVWTLNNDKHYQYAIVGFDQERKVRYVTVLARPDGQAVNYEDIGDLAQAARAGQPGNLRYTWKLNDRKNHFEYLAIVAGKDAHRLDRYTVKRLGLQNEEEHERD